MRCATHPKVETNLRCAKCDKPICPLCMVQTPVGVRCRECAKLKRLPTYEVAFPHYLKAVGVGFGLAIVLGIAWGLLREILPFYFPFLLAAGVGYAIGEVVSLSVGRKRGLGLQVVAGVSVVLGYLVSNIRLSEGILIFSISFGYDLLYNLLALALGVFIAVTRLR